MKKSILACFILACIFSSCSKEIIDPLDCAALENTKIISEIKKSTTCHYNDVYRYKGDIYTIGNCCECGMIYMAFDCSGTALCESSEDCMIDFDKKAKYLYAVKSK